jgi:hypothetical protein
MKFSDLYNLNYRDLLNGWVIAFLTAFLTAASSSMGSGKVPTFEDLKMFSAIGCSAGVSYLIKNLFTNNEGKFFKKDS